MIRYSVYEIRQSDADAERFFIVLCSRIDKKIFENPGYL